MRKIVSAAFVSLDGVMQAPGGPQEDTTGGFKYGGWTFPYFDETLGASVAELFSAPFDLLLGRRTYDIFAAYWPHEELDPKAPNFEIARKFNAATKYVATHRPDTLSWQSSQWLGRDVVAALRKLKEKDGPLLLTQGSSELIQTLLENGLIDELRLLTFPVLLGKGKRLFGDDTRPSALELIDVGVSPLGVMVATYMPAGGVKTGSFALEELSQAGAK